MLAAHKRTRTAFFLATLGSAVVLITAFNATLSWDRFLPASPPENATLVQKETVTEKVKHVVDREHYQLPLIGVQINTVDVGLFAPLSLLVFSFFFLASSRAAWSQMHALSEEPVGKDPQFNKLVKSEIVLNVVDDPGMRSFLSPLSFYRGMIFLPSVASLFALAADLHTFFDSPYDNPSTTVFAAMKDQGVLVRAIGFDAIGACLTVLVLVYNWQTLRYSRKIQELARASA